MREVTGVSWVKQPHGVMEIWLWLFVATAFDRTNSMFFCMFPWRRVNRGGDVRIAGVVILKCSQKLEYCFSVILSYAI